MYGGWSGNTNEFRCLDSSRSVRLRHSHRHDDQKEDRRHLVPEAVEIRRAGVSRRARKSCASLDVGLRMKVPMLDRGDAILFDAPAYIEQEDGVEYTIVSASNGTQPLFPRSSVSGKIPLKKGEDVKWLAKDGKPKEVRTLDHIWLRVWADSAPSKDFLFPIENVTKTFRR
jgi:hypothetical protein